MKRFLIQKLVGILISFADRLDDVIFDLVVNKLDDIFDGEEEIDE